MSISSLQNMFQVLLILCLLCLKTVVPHKEETSILEVESNMQTYIVHLRKPSDKYTMQHEELEKWYKSFLPDTSAVNLHYEGAKPSIIHSYHHVMVGFSAQLSPHHVEEMKNKVGFISARPERVLSLHTTRTPTFLGLKQNVEPWAGSNYGEGIIIGLLDSGISPKHQSFNDEGMPKPPSKWKGRCDGGIICNNKLIGAKNMISDSGTPIGDDGHGTHTSSTAAGSFVSNANVFGQANGTSVGMAPRAHFAMYKVCDPMCPESALIAGMDAAIDDGVDVISMSLGGPSFPYWDDSISRGAFAAMEKGIFVSCSAGNNGPTEKTLSNDAPWILTVGASSIDRNLRATVVLGNEEELDGETVNQPKDFPPKYFPLVFLGFENEKAGQCVKGSLENRTDVKGKIVVCLLGSVSPYTKEQTVKDAGGVGMILVNEFYKGYTILAYSYDLPVSHVSYAAGEKILAYLKSNTNPTASLVFKGTILGVKESPMMAFFSSRGPNKQSPGILKPDITGPGVNILAAWNKALDNTTENVAFNVDSGTSMSCPHLSGVASLIKSSHPDWSPAAIKSAIMTTAYTLGLDGNPIMDEQKNDANLLALGSGHVNPPKANDPGLVYDLQPDDYIPYLCGLNYADEQIEMIVQRQVQCSSVEIIPEAQLNYPSFSVELGSGKKEYSRTVTNVGEATSTYELILENCLEVDIIVSPKELVFIESNQKLTYTVTFSSTRNSDHAKYSNKDSTCTGAAIIWSDGKHQVRSPIYVQDADLLRTY